MSLEISSVCNTFTLGRHKVATGMSSVMSKSSSWSEEFSQLGRGIEPTTLAIALTPSNKSDHFTTEPLRRTKLLGYCVFTSSGEAECSRPQSWAVETSGSSSGIPPGPRYRWQPPPPPDNKQTPVSYYTTDTSSFLSIFFMCAINYISAICKNKSILFTIKCCRVKSGEFLCRLTMSVMSCHVMSWCHERRNGVMKWCHRGRYF